MQLGSFSIYLTALVLLTWTSSTLGAAIDLSSSPSKRDLGATGNVPIDLWKDEMLKRDDVVSTTDSGEPGGSVGDNIALAVRAAAESEEGISAGNGDLWKRWYTLVEIAESSDSSESE